MKRITPSFSGRHPSPLSDKLHLSLSLIQNIFHLESHILVNRDRLDRFCRRYRLIPQQSWLQPDALELIIDESSRKNVHFFQDALRLRVIFFYVDDIPILLGPYLAEFAGVADCMKIIRSYPNANLKQDDLIIYYGQIPVIADEQMQNIYRALLRVAGMEHLTEHYTTYRIGETPEQEQPVPDEVANEKIALHYMAEKAFMDAIKKGSLRNSLHALQTMRNNTKVFWSHHVTLAQYKIRSATVRTMARISAYEAGLAAPLIHRITIRESQIIASAKTYEQIDAATRDMICDLCELINQLRNRKYSALTQSVIYSLSKNYSSHISIHELAKELDLSENHLIRQFKKDTGQTPLTFLNKLRMEHAAARLISTNETIQTISSSVGISDSNYFVKIFKSHYSETPGAYRRKHKI